MNHEQYVEAAEFWKSKESEIKKVEDEKLKAAMIEYITANDTCALATAAGDFVRCTPIEYKYHHDAFWLFSEGGEKFYAIEKNKNVCMAIFEKYSGFAELKGMQITGLMEIVEPDTEEYLEAAKARNIPLEALKKMEHPMHLLKVTPKRIDFLNAEFKKEGYSSRQFMEF